MHSCGIYKKKAVIHLSFQEIWAQLWKRHVGWGYHEKGQDLAAHKPQLAPIVNVQLPNRWPRYISLSLKSVNKCKPFLKPTNVKNKIDEVCDARRRWLKVESCLIVTENKVDEEKLQHKTEMRNSFAPHYC